MWLSLTNIFYDVNGKGGLRRSLDLVPVVLRGAVVSFVLGVKDATTLIKPYLTAKVITYFSQQCPFCFKEFCRP